jgi:hypothetical protein
MSERNLELEIDELKKELSEILTIVKPPKPPSSGNEESEFVGHIYKTTKSKTFEYKSPEIITVLDRAENKAGLDENTGCISYVGVFASGDRQSTWISEEVNTDILLKLIETGTAEKVLKCIGNNDRLNILLAILKKSMTVAELVAHGGYSSTGQVYHHIKPLITADLIKEDKNSDKGTYFVQPHKVQGIIMLLAGISDMVSEKYTKGDWEQAQKETEE